MEQLESLLAIAIDLTRSMSVANRYDRFLDVIRQVIPCDAASLMDLRGSFLEPLAGFGLSRKALRQRYALADHPRLQIIRNSCEPVIFPPDSLLPDPFDHLLGEEGGSPGHVHSCMGCPLTYNDEVIGVFTADALEAGAFDGLDLGFLKFLGALAGAVLNTGHLIGELEDTSRKHKNLAVELLRAEGRRAGGNMVGSSEVMHRLREEIAIVARADVPVLITGESGVGKELVARAIHGGSARSSGPLIHVNCAALPESLAESELFGHKRGAFTGADSNRAGKFEVADGGTLFLDEIGELPPNIQAKLLRALQEGEVQRIGSDRLTVVDVRIVAATNRDLETAIDKGGFRRDLYHRLMVYPIQVPPLRSRPQDIEPLVNAFIAAEKRHMGLSDVFLAKGVIEHLQKNRWPGNVRELKNAVSRALLRASCERGGALILRAEHFGMAGFSGDVFLGSGPDEKPVAARAANLRDAVDAYQAELIREAVSAEKGNWSAAARRLGVDRGNLHHLASRLGLKRAKK